MKQDSFLIIFYRSRVYRSYFRFLRLSLGVLHTLHFTWIIWAAISLFLCLLGIWWMSKRKLTEYWRTVNGVGYLGDRLHI